MKAKKLILAVLFGLVSGAALGQTFTADINDGRNHAWLESDAPLGNIVGTSNKVRATLIFKSNDITKDPKLIVNMASPKTDINLCDEHLRSADYLNTTKYPPFVLRGLKASTKLLDKTVAVNFTLKFALSRYTFCFGKNRTRV